MRLSFSTRFTLRFFLPSCSVLFKPFALSDLNLSKSPHSISNLVGILTDVSYRINSSSTQKLPAASGASGVSTEGNFYEGSYSFDGTTDYIDVDASSEFDLGTGDFTVELWMRSWVDSADTYYRRIYMTDGPTGNAAGNFQLTIEPSTGKINLWDGAASGGLNLLGTTNVANNQWNHIAAVRSGGTLKGYVNGTQETSGSYSVAISPNSGSPRPRLGNFSGSGGTGDYNGFIQDLRVYKGVAKYTDNFLVGSSNPSVVTESPSGAVYSSELTKVTDGAVTFEGGDDDYLSLNPGADFAFGTGDFTVELYLYYNGAPAQYDYIIDARNSGQTTGTWSLSHDYVNTGSGLLMFSTDSSALLTASHNPLHNRWTHIAVSRNGSSLKMFYDGVEVATASNTTNFSTSPSTSYIGTRYSTEHSFVGLISNLRVVKGTALYTANFTPPTSPLTNVTNTKLLCCNFPDSATNSTVQPNAISATGSVSGTPFGPFDSNIDTVIGRPTNYCTLNPLSNGGLSLSDGNLKVSEGSGPHMRVNGTVGVTTGKWYYEVTNNSQPYDDSGQDTNSSAGIGNYEASLTSYPGSDANSYVYQYASDGNGTKKINGGTDTSWPTGFTAGTPKGVTVMIAFDLDNSKIWFGRQGIWLDDGDPVGGKNSVYALTSGMQYTPTCRPRGTGGVNATINFGQNPFKYPAPEGFSPVCGASIQTPEILRPDLYVGVTTFTGTGAGNGNQEVTFPFKPDMVITKQRSGTASSGVYDTVRGTNSKLYTNSASQANTNNDAGPASWDYRGVTLDDTGDDIVYNGAAGVAWGWKAGGNPGITTTGIYIDGVSYASAAAAGLDGGSIDPNAASIGTKEGFSILKYTADLAEVPNSIAHGLTKKPDFAIFKNIESTLGVNEVDWGVYHKSIGATKVLELNQNLAMQDYDGPFNDTEPTSSLFYFGGKSGGSIMGHSYTTNGPAGDDFIGYIWHDVPGLQKFGTYEGDDANGSGPFVDCGFRPSLILIKNVDAAQDWILIDGTRDPNNVSYRWLKPNSNGAENTTTTDNCIDILSNGFIPRGANTSNDATNGPSQTIVYAAWAAEPIHNLYGGQSNAR